MIRIGFLTAPMSVFICVENLLHILLAHIVQGHGDTGDALTLGIRNFSLDLYNMIHKGLRGEGDIMYSGIFLSIAPLHTVDGQIGTVSQCMFFDLRHILTDPELGEGATGLESVLADRGQALGQKNTVFAIWFAYTFMTPVTAIAGGFYSVWHNIVNTWQLYRKNHCK